MITARHQRRAVQDSTAHQKAQRFPSGVRAFGYLHAERVNQRLTTFRMNTCKSVSKQRTLTIFRMNTCEKTGGGGPLSLRYPSSSRARLRRQSGTHTRALSSRSRKYSFQLSGSAATRRARRNDFTSSPSYRFAMYSRVTSETGTAFSSREITLISSPAPTSPSRVTAK